MARRKWIPLADALGQGPSSNTTTPPAARAAEPTLHSSRDRLNRFAPPIYELQYYGNTEARILDQYRDRKGNVKKFSEEGIAYADYLAGRGHTKWLREKEKCVESRRRAALVLTYLQES